MRYLIPLENDLGSKSRISGHFGKAPYYGVIYRDSPDRSLDVEIKPASGEKGGGACSMGNLVRRLGVDGVIVKGIGSRALQILRDLGVKVYRTDAETLDQVLREIEEAKLVHLDMDEACKGCDRRKPASAWGGQVRR